MYLIFLLKKKLKLQKKSLVFFFTKLLEQRKKSSNYTGYRQAVVKLQAWRKLFNCGRRFVDNCRKNVSGNYQPSDKVIKARTQVTGVPAGTERENYDRESDTANFLMCTVTKLFDQ